MRKSTQIAIGFLVITFGGYKAYEVVTDQMVMNEKFSTLRPGDVNIVGIDAGAGYRIITANYMAQLVEASSDFQGKETDGGGATEGAIKRRVPVRELLQTLQGNGKALGAFVMTLNEMNENDTWPPIRVVWKAADLEKAIKGDAVLKKKLEADLNMGLDGMPLPRLDISAMENGIIIETPVTVTVNVDNKEQKVIGQVQEPYKPRMIRAVEEAYKEKGNVTTEMQVGYYKLESEKLIANPAQREIISESITQRISPTLAVDRAKNPERVLKSATVVVSDSFITGATSRSYTGNDGKPYFDMTIRLTDEGRRRLWQYSKKRVGTQLLITAAGIPVSAPRIQHELAQNELTISQLQDERLVKDAVDAINQRAAAKP